MARSRPICYEMIQNHSFNLLLCYHDRLGLSALLGKPGGTIASTGHESPRFRLGTI